MISKISKFILMTIILSFAVSTGVMAEQTSQKSIIKMVNGDAILDSDGTPKVFTEAGSDGPLIKVEAESTSVNGPDGTQFKVNMKLSNTQTGFIIYNFKRAEESYDSNGNITESPIAELTDVEYGSIDEFNIENRTADTSLVPDTTKNELMYDGGYAFIEYNGDEIVRANGESTILTLVYTKRGNGTFKPVMRELSGCVFVTPTYEIEPVVYVEVDAIKLGDGESVTESTTATTTTAVTTSKTEKDNDTTATTITEDSTEGTTKTEESEKNKNNENYFEDIAQRAWAVEAINRLAELKIVNGMGEGIFAPDNSSKRADFIIIVDKILGIEGTAKDNFDDVNEDKYYANYLGLAKEKGIATGYGNGNFGPEDTITRQDMMVLVGRMLEYKGIEAKGDTKVLEKFDDYDEMADYAKPYASYLVENDIVNGTGNNIEGDALMTRAQMCVLMNNIYDLLNK